jgi:uncharacterized protein YjiS (DUF1127 family)
MIKLKVKHLFKKLYVSMMRSQRRRAHTAVLSSLTDAQLRDIGIYRCDIPRIVAQSKK